MMDGITKDRIETLHPKIREEVYNGVIECEVRGVRIRLVQATRTFPEQDALFAQGRTKMGKIVTFARAGESFHNYGLAFDFCLLHKDGSISWSLYEDMDADRKRDWMEVVAVFEGLGFKWGGRWEGKKNDNPHFEKTFGHTWEQCKELHDKGKLINGYIVI